MNEKTLAYIPTSDRNAWPGEVKVKGSVPSFKLRCTVKVCGWKREVKLYAMAQSVAFAHAGPHSTIDERL